MNKPPPLLAPRFWAIGLLTGLGLITSCGGGGGSGAGTTAVSVATVPGVTVPATACPASAKGAASGVGVKPATPIAQLALDKRPAALAAALGLPARLAVGLGTVTTTDVQKQGLKVDIYDEYLVGVGATAWPSYNSPSGAYVQTVAKNADCMGAVPMFTVYQMPANGEGNMAVLSNAAFMQDYWTQLRLLFTQLKTYGKPALVNLEPDFWGYTQRINRDPTLQFALVRNTNADCSALSDDIVGVAGCMVLMAGKYAPNAYIAFPPSQFADVAATEAAYMKRIGADKADFAVMQTLDRDIGCFEAQFAPGYCTRVTNAKYWDASNTTLPHFKDHFAYARSYFEAIGLPLVWWQTPLGVPSTTPGGVPTAFRDNRTSYFLTRSTELVAAGGLGVVFSAGNAYQTSINTDGGQFRTLSTQYLAKPATLP